MTKKKYRLTGVRLFVILSAVLAVMVGLISYMIMGNVTDSLDSQTMEKRWENGRSVAQISTFFSANSGADINTIKEFRYKLDNALHEASISGDEEYPDARLWIDAYSVSGEMELKVGKNSVETSAYGVGGDFFQFHPLKLLSGSYFSESDLNQDCCVLDEDAAWQLFGSFDVAGMTLSADGKTLVVCGVIQKPDGRLANEAGVKGPQIYLSYQAFNELSGEEDSALGISQYELVMPNPVSNFALQKVQENMPVDEEDMLVIQNTDRFSLYRCLVLLSEYGTRSMSKRAIIFPYWENLARGYEDICIAVIFFVILCFTYATIAFMIEFGIWWKLKGWTFESVFMKLKDKLERMSERSYERRRAKKNKSNDRGQISFKEDE